MDTIKNLLFRIQFKVLRTFSYTREKSVRIKSGPIKGYKFSVSTGNNFLFGSYEEKSLNKLLAKIGEDDVIMDLGANSGYHSMAMATKTKNHIYAFEPFPLNISRLKNHLRINSIQNVIVKEFAVSNKTGEIEFSNTSRAAGNTYIQDSKNYINTDNTIIVKTTTIDEQVFGKEPLKPPQMIKIDVEGAEYDVLKGAERTIKVYRPIILLATHDLHLPGIKKKCVSFLEDRDYVVTKTDDIRINNRGLEDFFAIPTEDVDKT